MQHFKKRLWLLKIGKMTRQRNNGKASSRNPLSICLGECWRYKYILFSHYN